MAEVKITDDEPELAYVSEVMNTAIVERVEFDETLERHLVILDTGEVVVFSARCDGSHVSLAEVV